MSISTMPKKWNSRLLKILILSIIPFINSCSPEIEPVTALFRADVESIFAGESISFSDFSTPNPTSWNWTFEGGVPATSTEQNPVVTYPDAGVYDVTLTVSNGESENLLTRSAYIEVKCLCNVDCRESCSDLLVSVEDIERSYDVYLPDAYTGNSSLPLIIDLHGFTSTKENQRKHSDFEDIANEDNIIMAWPQGLEGQTCLGVGNYWNANYDEETDDIGYLEGLIDKLIADFNVDEKRVYVTGLSNGGFMSYSVACALSEKIAAVASVAGLMTDDLLANCGSARAVPVLQIHGTEDMVVPWEGDDQCEGGIASVDEIIAFWRGLANCDAEFNEIAYPDLDTSDNCSAKMWSYKNCDTDDMIKLIVVEGGGHSWPGSQNLISIGAPQLLPINNDIDASAEIWNFFKNHQLP